MVQDGLVAQHDVQGYSVQDAGGAHPAMEPASTEAADAPAEEAHAASAADAPAAIPDHPRKKGKKKRQRSNEAGIYDCWQAVPVPPQGFVT